MDASSITLEPPIRDVLMLLARRPALPVEYAAKVLNQDEDALWYRLWAGVSLGWLEPKSMCCGDIRYVVTEAGKQIFNETQ